MFSREAIGGSGKETTHFSVINLYLTACTSCSVFPFLFWDVVIVANYMGYECCCLQLKIKYIPIMENLAENIEK